MYDLAYGISIIGFLRALFACLVFMVRSSPYQEIIIMFLAQQTVRLMLLIDLK